MSNALTMFDNPKVAVPDYMKDYFSDEDSNITERPSVPSLSYSGKVWAITVDGEKTSLIRQNADGDEEPVSTIKVVILDFALRRGRAYFEGTYDPENVGSPLCWSTNGEVPDEAVPEPQCETCAACPMAIKGSRISDSGKQSTACSQHRMLAVVPDKKLDFVPLRLKLAVTSDYDKQSPDLAAKGWFGFQQYRDFLAAKGVKHSTQVVTKMRFDSSVDYPKVMFSPDRWTEPEELDKLKALRDSEEVKKLVTKMDVPAPVEEDVADEESEEPAAEKPAAKKAAPKKAAPKKAAKPKAEPEQDEDEDDDDDSGFGAAVEPPVKKAAILIF